MTANGVVGDCTAGAPNHVVQDNAIVNENVINQLQLTMVHNVLDPVNKLSLVILNIVQVK